MEVERLASPEEFLERAGTYLLTSEARHNLILGISDTLVRRPGAYPESQHWLVTHADAVTMAALRTPPFDLVLSDGDETSVATLVDALAEDAGAFPGVVGNRPTVDAFAERWRGATGRAAFVRMRQGVFEATEVAGVPTAGGEWLRAGPGDRPLVAEWLRAFEIETFPIDPTRNEPPHANARRRCSTSVSPRKPTPACGCTASVACRCRSRDAAVARRTECASGPCTRLRSTGATDMPRSSSPR